ncbi:MAG TPA: MgtC/SapB family protein [Bryobacteraceae bacterium]|nr:MgtC/SapB family protein [Bryobacteraceae bacterium]
MLSDQWPYLATLLRVVLALAIGLFIGMERQRRGKEAGLRTFGLAGLIGCLGSLIGVSYAIAAVVLVGVLVVILNVQTMRDNRGAALTTSAALLVTGFAGVLCGQGHTLVPGSVAVLTAALLAWKEPLVGFSAGLTEAELRSALLLAILAFVVYPALPVGYIGPWNAFEPRAALVTVMLIAGIGFVNYILWNIYGDRGVELTGFLGGLVNSSVTVSELSARVGETGASIADAAYRGILLATAAMLLRNAIILGMLAPWVLAAAGLSYGGMLAASTAFLLFHRKGERKLEESERPKVTRLTSPFSLAAALRFGVIFLALQLAGVTGQRLLGEAGVYVVSLFGGLFSSASAVAADATLAVKQTIPEHVAAVATVIASIMSVGVNLPLVMRAKDAQLTRRLYWSMGLVVAAGIAGMALQATAMHLWVRWVQV